MGFVNDLISGVKNNLKWQAQSAVVGGIGTGVKSAFRGLKNRCPQCGKPVTDSAANFCPNCRASLVLICKNPMCARQSPLGTKFCPGCGSKLKPAKSVEEEKPATPPSAPQS